MQLARVPSRVYLLENNIFTDAFSERNEQVNYGYISIIGF